MEGLGVCRVGCEIVRWIERLGGGGLEGEW